MRSMKDHEDPVATRMTFIVRLDASESEGATGIVEHASTGRKERFRGVEAISGVIAALMRDLASSQHGQKTPAG